MKKIESYLSNWKKIFYQVHDHIFSKESKYQKIDIIDNQEYWRMLFLDNDLQIAAKDAIVYNNALINPIKKNIKNAEILILWWGSGCCIAKIYKNHPKNILVVDIDKEVIKTSKNFLWKLNKNIFSNNNIKCIHKDALNFLKKNKKSFDIIVVSLTNIDQIYTTRNKQNYMETVIWECKNHLKKNWMISMQCCAKQDKSNFNMLKKTLSTNFINGKFNNINIPSFKEIRIFYHWYKK